MCWMGCKGDAAIVGRDGGARGGAICSGRWSVQVVGGGCSDAVGPSDRQQAVAVTFAHIMAQSVREVIRRMHLKFVLVTRVVVTHNAVLIGSRGCALSSKVFRCLDKK